MKNKVLKNKKIESVLKGSIAEEMDIQPGDELIRINHQDFENIIEYIFLISDEYLEVEIKKEDGSIEIYEIEKEFDEDLGIVFENPTIDPIKQCRNKCIFCFVDQLPSNMRKTLYVKDDDYRLSFLQGNFITFTNLTERDIDKIIQYKLSPIHVSIHTTDPELRTKMLQNKTAGNILTQLKKLSAAGIQMNGQIVLCPNINDKEHLEQTIRDLSDLYPNLRSVAIVPVGITKYRKNLYPLKPFDQATAYETIAQVEAWQSGFLKKWNTRFVFLSDEFYILANQNIPPYESYESFLQLENGVGLIAKFEKEFFDSLNHAQPKSFVQRSVSIATGKSSYGFMEGLCKEIEKKFPHINIHVFLIQNHYFGETITVSGLLTGKDIINQLKGKELGDELIIPSCMLKSDEPVFLDDIHICEMQEKLNVSVVVSQVDGKDFIDKVLG